MSTADTPGSRKARGAFFTPPEICRFLVDWTIRSRRDLVFEPSCGEAAFVLAAGERLRALGARPDTRLHLYGVDLHASSVEHARAQAERLGLQAELTAEDFFDYSSPIRFDAIVGNPPYVRYQGFTGAARRKGAEAALAQGVRLTALASSWAPFVVHAAAFLKPAGRLGLVLPAELLTVNYAAEVRAYLLQRFAEVKLVTFQERVFPGVMEEVVLLLAEGEGPTDHFEVFQMRDLDDLQSGTAGSVWSPGARGGKWSAALLPEEASNVYAEAVGGEAFRSLIEWGDPTLGMVTGNNKQFTLTKDDAARWGLSIEELLPISPPGSRHLRGLTFEVSAWEALRDASRRVYLFWPDPERMSEAARRHIKRLRRLGVHTAYKCRVRKPWWRTPLVEVPDLFLTYMNADAPRLVSNGARVSYLNSVHGLVLSADRALGMESLPIGMLNSVSLLGAELVGRSYGGGILKLEPREAELLPVPSPALLHDAKDSLQQIKEKAVALLAESRLDDVVALVDQALLIDAAGRTLDEVHQLTQARLGLYKRRVARSNGS